MAASSSIGSDIFAVLALLAVSGLILLLLRHFLPLRTTPAYLIVPIFLALALPVSMNLLVPIDLASSVAHHGGGAVWLPDSVLLVAWRLAYWLTFALTWFILPFLGEYIDSGYRSAKDRVVYSLRSNGRYYLIVFSCAGAAGIYVFLVNGFKTGSFKSLVMALAYCWGLIMAIYLMGHGLVAVPRRLIRYASVSGRLRRLQSQAPGVYYKLNDARAELQDLEYILARLKAKRMAIPQDLEEWINEMAHDAALVSSSTGAAAVSGGPEPPATTSKSYLASLGRKVMRARHKYVRFHAAWTALLRDADRVQTILDSKATGKLDFESTDDPPKRVRLDSHTRFHLHTKILPALSLVAGALLGMASVCIIWSEIIKSIAPRLSIVSLSVLHNSDASFKTIRMTVGQQIIAAMWLLYMCLAAMAGFSDVKIWGNRALVARNTYGESATWYSSQVAKLTVPLAYNFMTCLQQEVQHSTMFYKFLGVLINLTPLGTLFDLFFPLFILVPVCATLFSLYGRVGGWFRFSIFWDGDDEDDELSGGWREGKDLIARELQQARSVPSNASRLGLASLPPVRTSSYPTYRDNDTNDSPAPDTTTTNSNTRGQQGRYQRYRDTPPASTIPAAGQRLAAATAAAEEEDESIFSGFAHRLKNTIDNVERPAWLEELGSKRAKWFGGGGSSGSGNGLRL